MAALEFNESQQIKKSSCGGRKTNFANIENFFRKRETGLKYSVISRLTGIPISTLEGYARDFTRDANGNVIRKEKKQA